MTRRVRWFAATVAASWLVLAGAVVWLWPVLTQLFDPARIERRYYTPSESMMPTLKLGDSFRPLRVAPESLTRGTVVMFDGPEGARVARVVALGGDTVALCDGRVLINGRSARYGAARTGPTLAEGTATRLFAEQLPGETGVHHVIDAGVSLGDDFGPARVPKGALFVLGDDRDRAADSRYPPAEMGVGFVPVAAVVGRVDRLLWDSGFGSFGRPVDAAPQR